MKKPDFKIILTELIFLFTLMGCSPDKYQDELNFHRVEFTNVSAVFNLSRTNIHFGSYANDIGESAIMAADGDLLFLMFEDESLFIRYEKEYGKSIDVTIDTIVYQKFYDRDKLIGLNLTEDNLLMEWLDSVDEQVFSNLRTLQVTLPLSENNRSHLQKILKYAGGTGLVMESENEINYADLEILHEFTPGWAYLTDYQLDIEDERYIPMMEKLELLGIEGGDIDWSLAPDLLPSLESMILKEWDPLETGNYSFPNSKDLQSLTLVESNFTDLEFLEQIPGLRSFHAVLCDTLSNIQYLKNITSLKSLGMPFCEKISELGPVSQHQSLLWISYPINTSPEMLSQINSFFPNLQVIELIGCEEIEEIAFLENMYSLKCVILDLPEMDLTPLASLSNLSLLVLEEDIFTESSEEISTIQEAIPGLISLPGGGLCLGSGWILLLFPMVCIIWVFRNKRKQNRLLSN